ncbi:MAG TPA: hypothetical protein VLS89_09510 [Candidatus Nanopelagicales bacterium]|nr:hypothetical protein [Candidatus Nanopelagicales bacterium]
MKLDGEIGEAAGALEEGNALNPNALNPNALNPNALNPNALRPVALDPAAFDATTIGALTGPGEGGDLSRQLLLYTVRCALDSTQSVSFSWVDEAGESHDELYWGSLGLAPSWADEPLASEEDQRWVSACLSALTNWYGVSVIVSLRGGHPELAQVDPSEQAIYTVREGAFWGNLFSAAPEIWACHEPASAAYARSSRRDCAAGHATVDPVTGEEAVSPCGIVGLAGSCAGVCSPVASEGGAVPSCAAAPGQPAVMGQVITTYLR